MSSCDFNSTNIKFRKLKYGLKYAQKTSFYKQWISMSNIIKLLIKIAEMVIEGKFGSPRRNNYN